MTRSDQIARLKRAARGAGEPTSDFDLNPEFRPKGRKLREAAVLVAFVQRETGLDLILTKRSSALKHHPGQIAFPGGKVDAGDDGVIDAALREAEEEIGLPREAVEVLGTLPPHETVTGFRVTPVLALVTKPFDVVPELGEVEEVFHVPFEKVTSPEHFLVEGRFFRGVKRQYFVVPYGPYYIWGATARMLRILADRIAL
ncbi:MAG: CoA pyrophosphatase [Maritimibacter sp.]